MKKIRLTLEFKVTDQSANSFAKDMLARMHKYLSKWAVTVHVADMEINDVDKKN